MVATTGAGFEFPDVTFVPLVGGTAPDCVRTMLARLRPLFAAEGADFTGVSAHTSDGFRQVIVPLSPFEDPQEALATLRSRIKVLPASVDVVVQTSGSTTGTGHLVGISARALAASARATHQYLGGPGRWVLALSAHHIAGLQILVRSILARTDPLVVDTSAGFSPGELARALTHARLLGQPASYLSLVPTQLVKVLESGAENIAPLRDLQAILVGGAATNQRLLAQAAASGLPVVTTYGMSETGGGCVYDGVPLAGVSVRTEAENILISGPTLMEAYLDTPDCADDRVFTYFAGRRWLRTKDLGSLVDSRLVVTGRSDDIINTGGVKVNAGQVAGALVDSPQVASAAVVGVEDPRWGELVCAVVVPSPAWSGVFPDDGFAQNLRGLVATRLGAAHAPRVIIMAENLPLRDLGKVDRVAVKTMVAGQLAAGKAWLK